MGPSLVHIKIYLYLYKLVTSFLATLITVVEEFMWIKQNVRNIWLWQIVTNSQQDKTQIVTIQNANFNKNPNVSKLSLGHN